MTFAIGYVHPGKVHHAFVESMYGALMHLGPEVVVLPRQAGPNLARFRNDLIRKFFSVAHPKLEGMLFIDTDIVFTLDDVVRIVKSEYPITSALYWNPRDDEIFPVFTMGDRAHRIGDLDDIEPEPFPVAGVGMGFCYVKREVLKALGVGPLFPFQEMTLDDLEIGEDIGFSINAKRHGFQAWVNPDIEVRHIKEHLL